MSLWYQIIPFIRYKAKFYWKTLRTDPSYFPCWLSICRQPLAKSVQTGTYASITSWTALIKLTKRHMMKTAYLLKWREKLINPFQTEDHGCSGWGLEVEALVFIWVPPPKGYSPKLLTSHGTLYTPPFTEWLENPGTSQKSNFTPSNHRVWKLRDGVSQLAGSPAFYKADNWTNGHHPHTVRVCRRRTQMQTAVKSSRFNKVNKKWFLFFFLKTKSNKGCPLRARTEPIQFLL